MVKCFSKYSSFVKIADSSLHKKIRVTIPLKTYCAYLYLTGGRTSGFLRVRVVRARRVSRDGRTALQRYGFRLLRSRVQRRDECYTLLLPRIPTSGTMCNGPVRCVAVVVAGRIWLWAREQRHAVRANENARYTAAGRRGVLPE